MQREGAVPESFVQNKRKRASRLGTEALSTSNCSRGRRWEALFFYAKHPLKILRQELGYRTSMTLVLAACLLASAASAARLSFANALGSHMVLQRAPAAANVWGESGVKGAKVHLTLINEKTGSLVSNLTTSTSGDDGSWSFKLPPTVASSTTYAVNVAIGESKASLADVLFGGGSIVDYMILCFINDLCIKTRRLCMWGAVQQYVDCSVNLCEPIPSFYLQCSSVSGMHRTPQLRLRQQITSLSSA
jgi:hypothetical protein